MLNFFCCANGRNDKQHEGVDWRRSKQTSSRFARSHAQTSDMPRRASVPAIGHLPLTPTIPKASARRSRVSSLVGSSPRAPSQQDLSHAVSPQPPFLRPGSDQDVPVPTFVPDKVPMSETSMAPSLDTGSDNDGEQMCCTWQVHMPNNDIDTEYEEDLLRSKIVQSRQSTFDASHKFGIYSIDTTSTLDPSDADALSENPTTPS